MKGKIIILLFILLLLAVGISGCVPGDGSYTGSDPAGFFSGIWHGWIAPITLVISIFKSNISIYEPINTGFFYDFGFYIAIISGFGGIALSRKNK
ncbi:hypothetical protein [Dethiothermospora halolimnae]|uniref:hypothetical protein n=1 Tax=Dethiothermospora halolimnae TaxID=3114390 RepID=UPI003CCB92C9